MSNTIKGGKTYSEKLRDPRWQKKRLDILNRDNFTCQLCYNTESTLMVHHKAYEKGKEPWDYPDRYLVTLCEECHKNEHDNKEEFESTLIKDFYLAGFYVHDLKSLSESLQESEGLIHASEVVMSAFGHAIKNKEAQEALVDHFFEYLEKKAKKGKTKKK